MGEPVGDATYPAPLRGEALRVAVAADPLDEALPAGYHHVRRRWLLGVGDEVFERAVDSLFTWQMHRACGIRIASTTPRAQTDVAVMGSIGVAAVRLAVPFRVVAVIDEPDRRGFAYGTLARHPETGEEAFVVSRERNPTGSASVWLTVIAFSNPATRLARWSGPLGRIGQSVMADRYVHALQRLATQL